MKLFTQKRNVLNEFVSKKSITLLSYKKPLKCVYRKDLNIFIEKVPKSLTIIISRLVDIFFKSRYISGPL